MKILFRQPLIAVTIIAGLTVGTGCQPLPSPRHTLSSPKGKVPALHTSLLDGASCVEKLKNQIKSASVTLVDSPATKIDDDAKFFNREFQTSSVVAEKFGIEANVADQKISGLGIGKNFSKVGDFHTEYWGDLEFKPSNDKKFLSYTVSLTGVIISKTARKALSQKFLVKDDCSLEFSTSELSELSLQDDKVNYSSQRFSIETGEEKPIHSQAKLTIPKNFIFFTTDYFPDQEPNKSVFFSRDHIAVSRVFQPAPTLTNLDPIDGSRKMFEGVTVSYLDSGVAIQTHDYYKDKTTSFAFIRLGNKETRFVDEKTWAIAVPSALQKVSIIDVAIDEKKFDNDDSLLIRLKTNVKPSFPGFENYWKIKSITPLKEKDWALEYLLESNTFPVQISIPTYDPIAKPNTQNPFLKETTFIQISNTEVQKIVHELRTSANGNIGDMINQILKKVNETITFDPAMVEQDDIHAMKTDEIFRTRKGVCQHFSNLFTAIARGLNIPTRIVSGYKLSAHSAGAHTWNEVQVNSTIWLPVEPQMNVYKFNFREYFPLAISALYDDVAASKTYGREMRAFNLTNLSILSP